LGGVERYREYSASSVNNPNGTVEQERWTVQIDDIAQVDTLTVDNSAAVGSPVPLIRYQYRDHLGSAAMETNENGQVISYEEYHPFGTSAYRTAKSGTDLSLKRYRFTNKERDDETGLYYFGVRYYAAWLGRWTSSDPGGFVDGLNLYLYVRNNPVNGVDALGYSTEPPNDPEKGAVRTTESGETEVYNGSKWEISSVPFEGDNIYTNSVLKTSQGKSVLMSDFIRRKEYDKNLAVPPARRSLFNSRPNDQQEENSTPSVERNLFNDRPVELSDLLTEEDFLLAVALDLHVEEITDTEEIENKISNSFSDKEVEELVKWSNSSSTYNEYRKQSNQTLCMHFGLGGCEFVLNREIDGWRTKSGNYNFSGSKTVFDIGDDLVSKNLAKEVTPVGIGRGEWDESEVIINKSAGTENSIFLLGPGAAHHTLLATFNSNSSEFELIDQGTGWDKKGNRAVFNRQVNDVASSADAGRNWTKMYQLQRTISVVNRKRNVNLLPLKW
jgi:RHS repeat-associated protein